ncbi:hypothetical protein Tco_0543098 [Tanacetum coccineum]
MESDEVIMYSVANLVKSSGVMGFPDKMCDVPFRDNSPPLNISKDQFKGFSDSNDNSTSIDDDSFSIYDIDYVKVSPLDSELVSLEESPSTFPNSFVEETNTFDNSIPESETFCFNLEENSSGSTTTRSNYSLPDCEAFYFDDDHIEEKSSGSTTTHYDISLSKYDSFIFDLSNDPFPPAIRSDFFMRSSSMNSLTSYLHRSMIASILRVSPIRDCPDFEASRARGFVLRSLELHILSFIWESNILILSTNVYL